MTRSFFVLFAAVLLLIACNNNKPKENSSTSNNNPTTTGNSNPNPTASNNSGADMEKLMEEMKNLPALTNDQLKALLPETLLGMKRSSFATNSMMGYGIATGKYKSDDGKELGVIIYDCVGPAGVAWYNMMYWGMSMEQQDENGYKKTTTFNGTKAIESYDKGEEKYSLIYPSSNRLLVTVEGRNTGLDMVKQAAGSLNLKVN
jgi:hypothetical protein